jgi:hypothetical protein
MLIFVQVWRFAYQLGIQIELTGPDMCHDHSAQVSSSVAGPWEITVSSAAGSLVKRPQWILTLICSPGPTHRIRPRPAHSQMFTLKKLAQTAYKFNRGSELRVKAFLLRTNVELKNCSFKTVDQNVLK